MAVANGKPVVKKLKKKSFIVIEAPDKTTFSTATKVKKVERQGASAMTFDLVKEELDPAANPTRLLLSIRGRKDPSPLTLKPLIDLPESGDLTITLTDQGTMIDPVVTVPVIFVDDFDPGP